MKYYFVFISVLLLNSSAYAAPHPGRSSRDMNSDYQGSMGEGPSPFSNNDKYFLPTEDAMTHNYGPMTQSNGLQISGPSPSKQYNSRVSDWLADSRNQFQADPNFEDGYNNNNFPAISRTQRETSGVGVQENIPSTGVPIVDVSTADDRSSLAKWLKYGAITAGTVGALGLGGAAIWKATSKSGIPTVQPNINAVSSPPAAVLSSNGNPNAGMTASETSNTSSAPSASTGGSNAGSNAVLRDPLTGEPIQI